MHTVHFLAAENINKRVSENIYTIISNSKIKDLIDDIRGSTGRRKLLLIVLPISPLNSATSYCKRIVM
jgi:hypothetical protein